VGLRAPLVPASPAAQVRAIWLAQAVQKVRALRVVRLRQTSRVERRVVART
jgi:hypothetical protein